MRARPSPLTQPRPEPFPQVPRLPLRGLGEEWGREGRVGANRRSVYIFHPSGSRQPPSVRPAFLHPLIYSFIYSLSRGQSGRGPRRPRPQPGPGEPPKGGPALCVTPQRLHVVSPPPMTGRAGRVSFFSESPWGICLLACVPRMGRTAGPQHHGQRRGPRVPGPPAGAAGPPDLRGLLLSPDALPAPPGSAAKDFFLFLSFPQFATDRHFCRIQHVRKLEHEMTCVLYYIRSNRRNFTLSRSCKMS